MQTIQVGEFKAELSSILQQVQEMGEKFVIEYGKKHKKVAMLVPYEEEQTPRKFGQLEGQYKVPDDFNDESDEINAMFYWDKV
jgi:antitoxin (DNA-binding transcriptional repressor) of toxin-antitoxin stability system